MAATDVLQRISSSVVRLGQENGQFRQLAAQQNGSIGKFMRDIGKMFSNQSMQQSNLNNSLNNIEQTTSQTAQKVDSTNVLLGQSISIQTNMLNELKNISRSFEQMLEGQSGGAQGVVDSMLRSVGIAAGGAALGAAGATAVNTSATGPGGMFGGSQYQSNITGTTGEILKTIRVRESSENYSAKNPNSSASGAYQFIDSTWQGLTKKFGIGTEYTKASEAPPQVQDAIAAKYVEDILKRHNNDVSWVPREWFAGPDGQMSEKEQAANRGITVEGYVANWMKELSKHSSQGQQQSGQEKDDASAPQGTIVQKEGATPGTGYGGGAVQEKQAQLAGIRKQPLSPRLRSVLERAAASVGVEAVVYSGGQPPKGSGGARTGSTRHDNGNAADLWLEKNGRKLSDTNPEDKAIMAKFVSAAVQAGATGVGAGHGYMGPSNIHVGFGKQATWGGADWIKSAASGVFNNKDLGGGDSYGSGNYGEGSSNFSNMGGLGSPGGGFGAMMGGGQAAGGLPMPFPMMGGGLGGIFGAFAGISSLVGGLTSLFGSSGGSQIASSDPESEMKTDSEGAPKIGANNNKESDDAGKILNRSPSPNPILNVQSEPASIQRIQTAALETDALKFNQPQQQQQEPAAMLPNPSNAQRPNDDLNRGGYPSQSAFSSSPSWYMQLAGRIHYDDALKFKGGVLA